jgi:hypothetical protein
VRASFRETADRERLRWGVGNVRMLGESHCVNCGGHRPDSAAVSYWRFCEISKLLLVLNVVSSSSLASGEAVSGLAGGMAWYGSGGYVPPVYGRVGSWAVESPVKVRRPSVLAVLVRRTERGANGSSGSGQGYRASSTILGAGFRRTGMERGWGMELDTLVATGIIEQRERYSVK